MSALVVDQQLGFKRSVSSQLNERYGADQSYMDANMAWWPSNQNKQYLEIVAPQSYYIKNLIIKSGNPYSYVKTFKIAWMDDNRWVQGKNEYKYGNQKKGEQPTFYDIDLFTKGIRILPQTFENNIFLKAELEILNNPDDIKAKIAKLPSSMQRAALKSIGMDNSEIKRETTKQKKEEEASESEKQQSKKKDEKKKEEERNTRKEAEEKQAKKDVEERKKRDEQKKRELEQDQKKRDSSREEKLSKEEKGTSNLGIEQQLRTLIKKVDEQNQILEFLSENCVMKDDLKTIFKQMSSSLNGFKF